MTFYSIDTVVDDMLAEIDLLIRLKGDPYPGESKVMIRRRALMDRHIAALRSDIIVLQGIKKKHLRFDQGHDEMLKQMDQEIAGQQDRLRGIIH